VKFIHANRDEPKRNDSPIAKKMRNKIINLMQYSSSSDSAALPELLQVLYH
jgi:hypothetical protein